MSTKFDAAKKVVGWCSDPQNQAPGTQGLEVPGAQENANRRATGDSAIDWIDHSAKLLPNFGRPIKALSIGCGFGTIGRILRRRDYCQLIHSIDGAESAIEAARKAAAARAWMVCGKLDQCVTGERNSERKAPETQQLEDELIDKSDEGWVVSNRSS